MALGGSHTEGSYAPPNTCRMAAGPQPRRAILGQRRLPPQPSQAVVGWTGVGSDRLRGKSWQRASPQPIMTLRLMAILHEWFSISMPPERCGVSGAGTCAPCKLKTDFVLVPLRRSPSKRFAGFGQCELLLTQAHNKSILSLFPNSISAVPFETLPISWQKVSFSCPTSDTITRPSNRCAQFGCGFAALRPCVNLSGLPTLDFRLWTLD
jgi:hypothetical protein